MTTYAEQRDTLLAEARTIAKRAEAEGRDLTRDEAQQINAKGDQISNLNEKIRNAARDRGILDQISGLTKGKQPHGENDLLYRDTSRRALKTMSERLTKQLQMKLAVKDGAPLAKDAGWAQGSVNDLSAPVEYLFDGYPLQPNNLTVPFLSVMVGHLKVKSPEFRYIRMSPAENNATIVPRGELKPTSPVTADEITGTLSVLAHTSQGIDEYWSRDHGQMLTAYNNELLRALLETEEKWFLHGDGEDGRPTGILNTSGILTHSYSGSLIETTRKAITTFEVTDMTPSLFVLHPQDWETIELARDASGRLEFEEGPVNRSEHRLWGIPVCVSHYLEPGTGVLMDTDSAHLISDGQIRVESSSLHADDWLRNQFRIRLETRMAVAVTRPHGIMKLNLTAGAAPAA